MKNAKMNPTRTLTGIYYSLYNHFGPQHWWPGDTPFEIAVGAILTQNTNWGNVEKAINNLKNAGVLSAKALYEMPAGRLASLIRPAGYYNIKAQRLHNFLAFLMNHFRGRMKEMKKEDASSLRVHLLGITGIGPETADSILLYALEKPFFVIDAYTKRILQRHRIISTDTSYHELQELFHLHIPSDVSLFNEYHALLVMAGKHYCKPKPACERCPLKGTK